MTDVTEAPTVVSRQLISAVHHNLSRYDSRWFGQGQCVLVVERVRFSNGTSAKRLLKFKDPKVRYRVTAEAARSKYPIPELFVRGEDTVEYDSPLKDLDRHAAEHTDQMDYFRETRGPGQSMRRRKLHDHRFLHGTDVNVTDHYMDRYMEWALSEERAGRGALNTTSPLEMAYADIEVDGIDVAGFPDELVAAAPINLLTYLHRPTRKLTQFIARTMARPNPQVAEFEDRADEHRLRILCEVNRATLEKGRTGADRGELAPLVAPGSEWRVIAAQMGLIEGVPADPETVAALRCIDVELRFFDTELETILAFLRHVNEVDRPDTLAFWNLHFDANTILGRLRRLGADPEAAFTPAAFADWPLAVYNRDEYNTQETDRSDTFTVAAWTTYVDQMLLYASLRKQTGKKASYALDFTLQAELGESKLDFEGSIRDLAYRDYPTFVLYGALDVVPMATLEDKTEDIALAYQISMLTRTRFHKVMKKTVCLRNFANVFYRDRGFALSNNRNRNRERTNQEQFQGGLVVEPTLMERVGTVIGGEPSDRVYDNVVDFDATAQYPRTILAFNIDASGQVGRLVLPGGEGEPEQDSSDLMTAWASGDPVEVGRRWLGMPGLAELADLVLEERQASAPVLEEVV